MVNLTNSLPVATSIQFPGQTGVMVGANSGRSGGHPAPTSSLWRQRPAPADPCRTASRRPRGTYLYESGSDPQLQVQMGLFGALVVRPADITITGA